MRTFICLLVTVFTIEYVSQAVAATYCTVDTTSYYYNQWTTSSKYCDYGCCGSSYDHSRKCCEGESTSVGVYAGGGVGGVTGFLITLCIIYYCCCRTTDRVIAIV
ncbi:uncharacterized protein LOC128221282 [Mya arenaria]|uniref:uncharacterized protein LOC128221281 n=1 Tax=Mya arenaria TaxID=6604 RepID=UPI0022E5EC36|nr:uncharacterized protein LOC128221281 [Mya arenaria]XP_052785798.1 uncharacterized protein LOC128221282 [Mya arenaria]